MTACYEIYKFIRTSLRQTEVGERRRWASMWTSDESVGPRAPVGAWFYLLSLSKKGQERSISRWASSPASIYPSSFERSLLRWEFRPPSGSPPSVGRPTLRGALCSLSGSPSSVGCSALHRALRLLSGVPPSVEFSIRRSVVHWAFITPFSVPPSAGLSAFRRASCPPSGSPFSVGLSVFRRAFRPPSGSLYSVGRFAVRQFLHSAISRPLSVPPSFERFEDCVLHTPTGYSFNDPRTVFSTRQQGPASSDMSTVSYISWRDLASSDLRTMSSKSGLISCTLSMS